MTGPDDTRPLLTEERPVETRFDPLSLIAGTVFIAAAVAAMTGVTWRIDGSWVLPSVLIVLALWLLASAVPWRPGRDRSD